MELFMANSGAEVAKKSTERKLVENLLTPIITALSLALGWTIVSRAYWKRKASRNGGVSLVCYPSNGEAKSYRQINLKHFPGKQKVALGNAYEFLDREGFKQINTASRTQVFASENERVEIFFLSDGIVSETMF